MDAVAEKSQNDLSTQPYQVESDTEEELKLSAEPHAISPDTLIRIAKQQYSVYELLRKVQKGNLILSPDFQRKDTWNRAQQSELIESILIGIPIPLIYLFESETGSLCIIDGKQRITALKNFIDSTSSENYSLISLNMLSDLNGKKFKDLTPEYRTKIEDYQIHTYVIQPPTPESVKFNIFERVNRAGVKLNKQEMRHALYQGHATDLIQRLAESEAFKKATGDSIKTQRMRDRYLILRFIAFYLLQNERLPNVKFKSDIDKLLAQVMKFLNYQDQDFIQGIEDKCLASLNVCYLYLGSHAFRFQSKDTQQKRPINMGLFETLIFAFIEVNYMDFSKERVIEIIKKHKENIDAEDIFSGKIGTQKSFNYRFDIALKIRREIMQENRQC